MSRTPASLQQGLAAMKRMALALLGLAALLYIAAVALGPRYPHPGWGYLAAFAEAAMVGAMADWFAVVALFRHPLGLPIPHTAIIPRNKTRIGRNLAAFICDHFLGTAQVLAQVRAFDPAGKLAQWLSQPANAAKVGEHLSSAARYGLQALDDERVRRFIRDTVLRKLEGFDVSELGGQLLEVLTTDRRHQALLDDVLQHLGAWLDNEELQEQVADMIAAEVKVLRYVGLDQVAGRLATRKIVASVARLITEMGGDEDHPLRLRFDEAVAEFTERLRHDPAFRLKGDELKREVLAHPALAEYLHGLWSDLLVWLKDDLAKPESTIRERVGQIALTLGDKLRADTAMQQWINEQIVAAAPPSIDRYREDIRAYIEGRVAQWNTEELTRELEINIGRDLQFVRINGTLVGGLIGVLIHTATEWAR
jgi:uncharacterized membrane-anchored protein YjiN (DUF445 family)